MGEPSITELVRRLEAREQVERATTLAHPKVAAVLKALNFLLLQMSMKGQVGSTDISAEELALAVQDLEIHITRQARRHR